MNLAIDIGNSFSKLGVFNGDKTVYLSKYENQDIKPLKLVFAEYPIKKIIISSVVNKADSIPQIVKEQDIKIHTLGPDSSLPFTIDYTSPASLGTDRLAGIAGAYNMFRDTNVLVIDAGTAITYDVLTADRIYQGGNISPGLAMRFNALSHFTGKLPLISESYEFHTIGKNTEEAIRSGVQLGLIFEINEYIRNFKINYKDLRVIVTGGDGRFIIDNIEFSITFAPDLIVEGLNYILKQNA